MNLTYTQEPWAHQRQVIEACARPHVTHHALFWEVGTGKTATTINILRAKELFGKRVLIFCPLSVASNWVREIRKHAPEVPVKEILDLAPMSGARREKEMLKLAGPWGNLEKPKILIVNYDALGRDSFYAMLKEWSPEVLVCDESQRIKNPKALRTKRITELSTKCLNRYLLSGTPVLNSPMDIFSQFLVLDQGVSFGKNFFTFRAKYFEDKNATMAGMSHYFPKWVPRAGSLEEFNQKIARHSSRVIKSECLDLPELVKKRHFVELSPEQKRMYKEIKEEFLTWFKTQDDVNVPVVANIALTKLLRLQQVLSGFVKDAEGNTHRIEKNPRLEALRDLLEALTPDHKVIVWAIFKENYAMIREVCDDLGVKYAELTGETKDRAASLNAFDNDPETRVMIANQASGGVGVNMIEASYAIFYSKNFSLEQDVQAEGRNYRGGSEKHEKITRIDLVAEHTIDELVQESLDKKINVAKLMLDSPDIFSQL